MDTHQAALKPIGEVSEYKRNLIPVNIPGTYTLKPEFKSIASEDTIRDGVVAFRDFLFIFFERLMTDGQSYAKPPNKPGGMADYPFLNNISNLLVDMGYYGKLNDNEQTLSIAEMPLCRASVDGNGKKKPPKIPVSGQIECLRFLTLCGFSFPGISLDEKTLLFTDARPLEATYPNNPVLLAGLKALSIADMELRTGRRYWNDHNLLRCDYRLLKDGDIDITGELEDLLHPLPDKVKEFALKLHRRYVGMGLTCTLSILDDTSFSYALINKNRKAMSPRDRYQQRIWAFSYSMRNGYCLFVRAKKTDKYADVIAKFPLVMREKIAAGYGCYRKMGRDRCQGDCQGIRFPLDESILSIGADIETWLDYETPRSSF
jgi:hypothetical protein